MANPLHVNTVELLRRAGSRRDVDVTLPSDAVGIDDERIDPGAPVHVRLALESTNDGLFVTGAITFPWHGECRRCAVELRGDLVAPVDERYQEVPDDPDAFEFDGVQLDLEPMVRELVLLELPDAALCREACAGLCPTCGADLNAGDCGCAPVETDSPWAVLDELKGRVGDAGGFAGVDG